MERGSGRTTAKVNAEEIVFWRSYMGLDLGRDIRLQIHTQGSLHENHSSIWGKTVVTEVGSECGRAKRAPKTPVRY